MKMYHLMILGDKTIIIRTLFLFVNLYILFYIFSSCSLKQDYKKNIIKGSTQGTTYSITYFSKNKFIDKKNVDSILFQFDLDFSMWVENSKLKKINAQKLDKIVIVDNNNFWQKLLESSKYIYKLTEGYFDPTVYPVLKIWGFGVKSKINENINITDSILNLVDFSKLEFEKIKDSIIIYKKNNNLILDFNAIAQGYSVDILCDFLDNRGIKNYLVEIGGELKTRGLKEGKKNWKIGIDMPQNNVEGRPLKAILTANNLAIATSGSYRNFYIKNNGKKYSHIIDPKTGNPVNHHLLSVTVLAAKCRDADAFATAFLAMGKYKTIDFLKKHPKIMLDVYLIFEEKGELKTFKTKGIKKILNEI